MSKEFDKNNPWNNVWKYWIPIPLTFSKYPKIFNKNHYRMYSVLYSFRHIKRKTCHPPYSWIAARAELTLPQVYTLIKELEELHQIFTVKDSTYYKNPNHKFFDPDFTDEVRQAVDEWLGQGELLSKLEVEKLPDLELKKTIKTGSNYFHFWKSQLSKLEVGPNGEVRFSKAPSPISDKTYNKGSIKIKEVNNNKTSLFNSFPSLQSQIHTQISNNSQTLEQWGYNSSEATLLLADYRTVGFIEQIKDKVWEKGHKAYLNGCLRKKDSSPNVDWPDIMEQWIPEHLLTVYEDRDWFPWWERLQHLSHKDKKPVSDLFKEGLLDYKIDDDIAGKISFLEEFTPKEIEMLRDGTFDKKLLEYNKKLAEEEAQIQEIKTLKADPRRFFEEIVKPMLLKEDK